MMTFIDFSAAHGLILKSVEFGRWIRVPTEDKPGHKNGAYKHLGDVAFVQNHATMPDVACWFPDGDNGIKIDRAELERIRRDADRHVADNREKAAQRAAAILRYAKHEQHAYLDDKGFPDTLGLVHYPDENTNLLVIPMRVGKQLTGCQLINRDGEKKFLFGQRCSNAEFVIGSGGFDVWCEGYATGLSVHACLTALKTRCCIHICFSASNMEAMAKSAGRGFVIADNDDSGTGERAATATGLRFFMPKTIGQDFNDLHRASGTFTASQMLRQFMQGVRHG